MENEILSFYDSFSYFNETTKKIFIKRKRRKRGYQKSKWSEERIYSLVWRNGLVGTLGLPLSLNFSNVRGENSKSINFPSAIPLWILLFLISSNFSSYAFGFKTVSNAAFTFYLVLKKKVRFLKLYKLKKLTHSSKDKIGSTGGVANGRW